MQSNQIPFASVCQAQLDASRRCADAIFSGTEKIDHVMLDAAHHAVQEQLKLAEAMAGLRDPQTLGDTLGSGFLSSRSAEVANYQRQLVSIYTEMQAAIGRTMQEYAEQVGGSHMPNTSRRQAGHASVDSATSMFALWETALRQAAELTQRNMETARSAFESAAAKAIDGAAGYAGSAADRLQDMGSTLAAANAATNARTGVSGSKRK